MSPESALAVSLFLLVYCPPQRKWMPPSVILLSQTPSVLHLASSQLWEEQHLPMSCLAEALQEKAEHLRLIAMLSRFALDFDTLA